MDNSLDDRCTTIMFTVSEGRGKGRRKLKKERKLHREISLTMNDVGIFSR